ncbi:MAG: histidine phosphatase family protein [Lachnospiraceae bacterium]|nr:histidine phosphatase family protein [Lachnospiraceae bacterium]
MKIQMYLIRHGKTQGNLEKRYVGTTDEQLCEEGREMIRSYAQAGIYPKVQAVFTSPMKRCKQTAALIYPELNSQIITGIEETDFGIFEYKNYEELCHEPVYQQWIDSNGTMAVPGAESSETFSRRLRIGFMKMMQACEEQHIETAACVVHGGVIMEFMQMYGIPREDYYYWQVKNGCGLAAEVEIEHENFVISFRDWIRP